MIWTQNQALNALLFLHRDVLGAKWKEVSDLERGKEPEYLPVVPAMRKRNPLVVRCQVVKTER